MTPADPGLTTIGLAALGGAALGLVWLGLIWWSVALGARRGAAWPVLAGLALRLGLLGATGLAFVAWGLGAWDALAGLLGFIAVRTLVLAVARSGRRWEAR